MGETGIMDPGAPKRDHQERDGGVARRREGSDQVPRDPSGQCRAIDAHRESDRRLRAITSALPVLIAEIDADGRFCLVNDTFGEWFGYPVTEIVGRHYAEIIGSIAERVGPHVAGALAGDSATFESSIPARDGQPRRHVHAIYVPRRAESGQVDGLYALAVDVTDRRRAEAALRASEERFRAVADLVPDLLWSQDGDGRANWCNQRWLEYTGLASLGMDASAWQEAIHPDEREQARAIFAAAMSQGTALRQEMRLRRADGAYRWFLVQARPLRDASGRAVQWFGAATDIHEQRSALEALRRSEARFRTLSEAIPQLVWTSLDHGSWDWAGPQWLVYTGLSLEASRGSGWYDAVHPADQALTRAAWQAATALGQAGGLAVEHRLRGANGAWRWFQTRAMPFPSDGCEGALRWFGTSTDVDDMKRAQTALRASEARFRQFAENSSDVLWIMNATTREADYVSPAFSRIWGHDAVLPARALEIWAAHLHPDDRTHAMAALPTLLAGGEGVVEYRIIRSDGAIRWIRDTGFLIRDADGAVLRAAGIARDVTEQKAAARQQDTLIAELQHRVKNILAMVRAIASQTMEAAPSLDAFHAAFEGRINAMARAQALLLRHGTREAALGDIVENEVTAYDGRIGDNVQVDGPDFRLQPKAAQILAMAFHELATNAVKYGALGHRDGHVGVRWWIEGGAGPTLHISWTESGVALIDLKPARRGQGRELIEDGLAYELHAESRLAFTPGGVRCTLSIPIVPEFGHIAADHPAQDSVQNRP